MLTVSNGQFSSNSQISRYPLHFFKNSRSSSFVACIPQQPGEFHLYYPNSDTSSIQNPVTLTWETPNPIGQGCTEEGQIYQIFLGHSASPPYFKQVSSVNLSIASLEDGEWFWHVRAVNAYYSTDSVETSSFVVLLFLLQLPYTLEICNPQRPTLPDIITPANGEYISDSTVNLTFYGSGQWGTSCSPIVSAPFYEVL